MKKYINFFEFYSDCILILNNTPQKDIQYFRENCEKCILNRYFCFCNIPQSIAYSIGSKTTLLKFSVDNMIKNLIEHPEITLNEYKNIPQYIKNANYILKKNNKNLIYFVVNEQIYQFVIKRTISAKELFITTFHKASSKQLKKDIQRYQSIKTDSSDYEDSNYPSVT